MFIIAGTKVIGRTIKTGAFFCPTCNIERSCRLRKNDRYLSLFYIPLFPIGQFEDTLECTSCKTAYIPSTILLVRDYDSLTINSLDRPLAPIGKRIGSYIIDMIILLLLNFPLAVFTSDLPDFFDNKFYLLYLPIWVIYFFAMEFLFKGTIGKKILSIKIASEKAGAHVTCFRYFIRSIVKCIPVINIIFLFNNKRKGVHDFVANTIVIEK